MYGPSAAWARAAPARRRRGTIARMSTPDLQDAFHDLPDAPLLVGYSGGLDSTVLLHVLARRAPGRVRAVHVNHGLQAAADAWAAHCRATCAEWSLPFEEHRVDVRLAGQGPEAAARQARLQALEAALRPGEVLVLAHHREDQAETFLLRALRGSGVDGLAAMRRWRGFGRGRLWRPLLDTPRAALEAHARGQALAWVEDPGNAEAGFDRNFLRNRVLPLLATRWPHATASLARSAALCADASTLLAARDQAWLAEARADAPERLSRPALDALDASAQARALRAWVEALGLPPLPAGGVERVRRELLPAPADAVARYHWHGAEIHAWRDALHAGPVAAALPGDWATDWDGTRPCPLPGGGWLEISPPLRTPRPMRVRARRGGERIVLPGRRHGHALKHVLQEAGIPPWERTRLPLVGTADGTLLAAGDRVLSGEFQAWLGEQDSTLHWRRGDAAGTATPSD